MPNYKNLDCGLLCTAVESTLHKVSLEAGGEAFEFSELYYPLSIADGQLARSSYSEQISKCIEDNRSILEIGGSILSRTSSTLHTAIEKGTSQGTEAGLHTEEPSSAEKTARDIISLVRSGYKVSNAAEAQSGDSKELDIISDITSAILGVSSEYLSKRSEVSSDGYGIITDTETTEADFWSEKNLSESGTLILPDSRRSRIIVLASAGHGKTTLLRRIALHYASAFCSGENERFARRYGLPSVKELTPVMVYLRNFAEVREFSIKRMLAASIADTVSESSDTVLSAADLDSLNVRALEFCESAYDRLLLLIDGLDELPDDGRLCFLEELSSFLQAHPSTRILMSSRVSALSSEDGRTVEKLRHCGFRARSIVPMSYEEAVEYAKLFIEKTQPADSVAQCLRAIERINLERRFMYLKEFMHTPLLLRLLLRQITNGTLSQSRNELFKDMLHSLITSHHELEKKSRVFEDTMTLLSFLAYRMQSSNELSISSTDIEAAMPEIAQLSFHTEEFTPDRVERILSILDLLATSTGLVEKSYKANKSIYVFPIRSHLEYLCSWAVCRLALNSSPRPEPVALLIPHMSDDQWNNTLRFALSDRRIGNRFEYEQLIDAFIKCVPDTTNVNEIIDYDIQLNKSQALELCRKFFKSRYVSKRQNELLDVLLASPSAANVRYALKKLAAEDGEAENFYLEAATMGHISELAAKSVKAYTPEAEKLLRSNNSFDRLLGADMLQVAAENGIQSVTHRRDSFVEISAETAALLHAAATKDRSFCICNCMRFIWLSKLSGAEHMEPMLDGAIAAIIIDALEHSPSDSFTEDAIYALGGMPLTRSVLSQGKRSNQATLSQLKKNYDGTLRTTTSNRTCGATAEFIYTLDRELFARRWVLDICGGRPSAKFTMTPPHTRKEMAYFEKIKGSGFIKNLERDYPPERLEDQGPEQTFTVNYDYGNFGAGISNGVNSVDVLELFSSGMNAVFELFRKGDIAGAADLCYRQGERDNLCFLVRYGGLDVKRYGFSSYEELCESGLNAKKPMVTVNYALHLAEQGKPIDAAICLHGIGVAAWPQIISFWKDDVWERFQSPEGALVCLFGYRKALPEALYSAQIASEEGAKMLAALVSAYTELAEELKAYLFIGAEASGVSPEDNAQDSPD